MKRRTLFQTILAFFFGGEAKIGRPIESAQLPIKTWAVWLKSRQCFHVESDRFEIDSIHTHLPAISFFLKDRIQAEVFISSICHVEEVVNLGGTWFVTGNFIKFLPNNLQNFS